VPAEAWVEPPAVRHARERFTEVQALKAQGLSQMEIARCTGLARPTVHKYYTAAALEDVHLRGFEPRPSVLDPFKPYLYEHFRPGVTTIGALYRDLRDRGYTGSFNTVARYLATLRTDSTPPTAPVDRDSPRLLNPYKDYLRERFRPGTSAATLAAEIADRGYTGCVMTVARYLATLRPAEPKPPRRGTDATPGPEGPRPRRMDPDPPRPPRRRRHRRARRRLRRQPTARRAARLRRAVRADTHRAHRRAEPRCLARRRRS